MRLGLAQIWGLVILAGKFERIEFRGYELVRARSGVVARWLATELLDEHILIASASIV